MTTPADTAAEGLELLKEAIVEFLKRHEHGVGNSDIAKALGLESDFEGSQKNYLSWSILGILVKEDAVRYEMINRKRRYFANGDG